MEEREEQQMSERLSGAVLERVETEVEETEAAETTEEAYLRGRNDAIREQMSKPGMWESEFVQPEHGVEILRGHSQKRSIWDIEF